MKKILFILLFSVAALASHAATDYGISVAGVRVTSDNKDNITGTGISNGTVSYNPYYNMLYLKSATIDVRNLAVNAITNDYGARANLWIRLEGNNLIKASSNAIVINVKESQGFILDSSDGTGTLYCDGALYLDARDHLTNDCALSTIRNCTVRFGDIMSDDYEECLTIENAQVITDYLSVGSDHSGQKGLNLSDCYLAYPSNGVVGNYGTVTVDDDYWYGHVEINRGSGSDKGDVNGDGHVNSADITALYDYLLNGDESSLVYGDQDGDGHITSGDVTAVYDILLGNVSPSTGNDIEEYTVNDITFKMIKVICSSFMMGYGYDAYARAWEKPAHWVTLTNDYYIGQTEVTQGLWKAVMGGNPSQVINNNRPVEWVGWYDCQKFILKLSQMTGKIFRLPYESEWEYAARGGMNTHGYKYAGSNNYEDVGWVSQNSEDITHYVAQKAPNELGIYDMTGNVSEFCQDWFGENYYSTSPSVDPTGPSSPVSGERRVARGGDFHEYANYCRVFNRSWLYLSEKSRYVGLRLASYTY